MNLFLLAFQSLMNRRVTTGLTILTIAMSVALVLGIERLRHGTKQSFERTVSGVDLIVGARSSPINLLLYTVFRIGNPTNNVDWKSYQELIQDKRVKWAVPISLGDSHRGFRVVGTTADFFTHIGFGGDRQLRFAQGTVFGGLFEAVIGAEVAAKTKYQLGQKIVLSHGTGQVSFQDHGDKPFQVVGILERTGTPMDHSVHISLAGIEALHVDWQNGAPPLPGQSVPAEQLLEKDLVPHSITAFFVGLHRKTAVLSLRREINEYEPEALSAIMPGASLMELWSLLAVAEKSLLAVSALVFVSGLVSMLLALLSTLNERRREMAIFRSLGASVSFVFGMLLFESFLLAVLGSVLGVLVTFGSLIIAQPILESHLGLTVGLLEFGMTEALFLGTVLAVSLLVGALPGLVAYRQSLSDGLTVRT